MPASLRKLRWLDPEKEDAWGVPALRIHASYGENEHAMAKAMRQNIGDILEAMKLRDAHPAQQPSEHFREEYP